MNKFSKSLNWCWFHTVKVCTYNIRIWINVTLCVLYVLNHPSTDRVDTYKDTLQMEISPLNPIFSRKPQFLGLNSGIPESDFPMFLAMKISLKFFFPHTCSGRDHLPAYLQSGKWPIPDLVNKAGLFVSLFKDITTLITIPITRMIQILFFVFKTRRKLR